MKTFASCAALAAVAFLGAALPAPAQSPSLAPVPIVSPTPTAVTGIASPPPTLGAASAAGVCADDTFLAFRTVPEPIVEEVTVCGLVTDGAPASPPMGRGAVRPSFALSVDGTPPVAIEWDGAMPLSAHPGDVAIVHGRYHRDNGGGEGINSVRAETVRGRPFNGYVMLNGTLYH